MDILNRLILYIIGFTLRSCLYETISGYSKDIPLAKESPKLRKRVETPIWHIVLFILGFFIPLVNIFIGCISITWGMADNVTEFHLWEENTLSRLFGKIYKFMTNSAW